MNIKSWQKFDQETALKFNGNEPKIDHKESAIDNLKAAGNELLLVPFAPIYAAIIPEDVSMFKSWMNKLGNVGGRLAFAIAGPFYMLGLAVKNGVIDATAHGAASLFDK